MMSKKKEIIHDVGELFFANPQEGVWYYPNEDVLIAISNKDHIAVTLDGFEEEFLAPRFQMELGNNGPSWHVLKPCWTEGLTYLGEL